MRFPRPFISVAALALAVSLAGCSAATSGSSAATGAAATVTTTAAEAQAAPPSAAAVAASIEADTHFDSDDLDWDAAEEVAVTLADGASAASDAVTVDGDTVTLTAAGTYRLGGSLSDGQIVVAAGEEAVVRIILDGAEVASSTGSPFVVTSANEAIIYLADGSTNTLTDADTYADTGEEAPNAALYSMADLTIAGPGSLTVTGNANDGITAKDGLVLAGGTVTVEAADDGIRGKDYTVLLNGTYQVTAGGDGVKSDNEDDEGRGWLLVSGGALTVSAGDDGVKAYNLLTVTGGTVDVAESTEGLEASHIAVGGGTVSVSSSDDGINAAGGTSTATSGGMGGPMGEAVGDYTVMVTGGEVTIDSEGDGLDSNGNATVTGGTVVINGPTNNGNGALDVNGELTVDGGTLAAAGSSGMAVTPGTSSAQSGVQVTFGSALGAGTVVQLADSSGTLVATFATTKATASLVFSSAAITAGQAYTVYTGGSAEAEAGIGGGSLDGATEFGTVTAGEYTAAQGPGRR